MAAALATLLLPTSARAAPGDLDPGFSDDGMLRTDLTGVDAAFGVALQPDGKIIAAGEADREFALARYKPDGRLDRTFSGDGLVRTRSPGPAGASSVTVQPDGKILVAGEADGDFALLRYQPNGVPDLSFSEDGEATADFGGRDQALALALQPDGRVVLGGYTENESSRRSFALARFNPDGSLDATFSGDGKLVSDVFTASEVALQPDGRIVAGGTSFGDFLAARYLPDGTPDPSFSDDGTATADIGEFDEGTDLTLQPDGKIVVTGWSGRFPVDFALARFNPQGTLDPSFSGDGTVAIDLGGEDQPFAVAVQPDGRIVIAGMTFEQNFPPPPPGTTAPFPPPSADFGLARFNPDGSLDASFAGDGTLNTDFMTQHDAAFDAALQPDGRRIVLAGATGSDFNFFPLAVTGKFALARYELEDGSPDADADGTLDPGDRCPSRYGRKHSGCPRHPRSLTLDYSNTSFRFQGGLSSPYPPCVQLRKVAIFKRRPGRDRKVAADETEFSGGYSALDPGFPGRYYATSPRTFEPEVGICAEGRSRELKL